MLRISDGFLVLPSFWTPGLLISAMGFLYFGFNYLANLSVWNPSYHLKMCSLIPLQRTRKEEIVSTQFVSSPNFNLHSFSFRVFSSFSLNESRDYDVILRTFCSSRTSILQERPGRSLALLYLHDKTVVQELSELF